MSGIGVDLNTWPIEDLFLIPSDDSVDDEGEPIHCLFSKELDAVTYIDAGDLAVLRQRGIQSLDRLPEDDDQVD